VEIRQYVTTKQQIAKSCELTASFKKGAHARCSIPKPLVRHN
jgi:hypothetical protein